MPPEILDDWSGHLVTALRNVQAAANQLGLGDKHGELGLVQQSIVNLLAVERRLLASLKRPPAGKP